VAQQLESVNHVDMSFGQVLVWVALVIVTIGWFVALIDAIRRPKAQWQMAGQNKVLYLVMIIFLGWFGALLYAMIPWPQLKVAASRSVASG
jgi:hypothetical protein